MTATDQTQPPAPAGARTCRRCGYPITRPAGGAWTVTSGDTANGLSYCPPDPDARSVGLHVPKARPIGQYRKHEFAGNSAVTAACESCGLDSSNPVHAGARGESL